MTRSPICDLVRFQHIFFVYAVWDRSKSRSCIFLSIPIFREIPIFFIENGWEVWEQGTVNPCSHSYGKLRVQLC